MNRSHSKDTTKEKKAGSIFLTALCWVLAVLFLAAGGLLIYGSYEGAKTGTFSLAGIQFYLTNQELSPKPAYQDSLIAVRPQADYQPGDQVFVSYSEDGGTAHGIFQVAGSSSDSITLQDDAGEEFTLNSHEVLGRIFFSSPALGRLIFAVSAPEHRLAVIGILAGSFVFLLLLILIPTAVLSRRHKKAGETDAGPRVPKEEPLYQVRERVQPNPARPAQKSPLFLSDERDREPLPMHQRPQPPKPEAISPQPQPTPQPEKPVKPVSKPSSAPSSGSYAEDIVKQIMEEEHIDLSQVEITMTDEELDRLKEEVLRSFKK